ncbi:MAG: alpha/beta hydrolase [Modestobacter sp.]|nr:alpha/beta hydrolase [Modestobacter sp.]
MTLTDELPGTRSGTITVNDGTRLHYLEAGAGPDLLLVPGWSQTAAQWRKQIEDFSATHHVIAVDMRGHGESDKPDHGYRIARLATDLHDLVNQLDLTDVTWIAHSMGASITWAYWDLFGGERIGRLVLVDQPAVLVADTAWEEGQAASLSAIFDYAAISGLNAGLCGPDAGAVTSGLIGSMFTDATDPAEIAWAVERNHAMPRAHAGTLLIDHAYADWRDVLPRIDVPTLVIAGAVSIFPPAGVEWVATQIPQAQSRTFTAEERGSHFMFWENPELFNQLIRDFAG